MSGAWTPEQATLAAGEGFGAFIGIRIVSASALEVSAEIAVGPHLLNDDGIVHGGALMAIGDTLGGVAARLSLPPRWRTVTSQSATYFLRPARGPVLLASCEPEHRGRRFSIWRTELSESSHTVALVTQTQMHLSPER